MWLLGAGASASAGIPTAGSLIWQFKRTLFCAAQRVSVKSCEDLSSIAVQGRLQSYFDNVGGFPSANSAEEYAFYFEATYPDAADRRVVLESYLAGAKPSYGHLVLAALMKMNQTRIVWTPNFDKVIEDAAVQMTGSTSQFVVAALDNAQIALQALNEGRWPLIAKMHGDFQSRRLKNTPEELRNQDSIMRRALIESCKRYGLIVVGYSGRDESIVAALEEAIDEGRGYPGGLFWFQRPDSVPFPAVEALIAKADKAGIQAKFIEVQTFDELLGDIIKQFDNVPQDIAAKLESRGTRLTEIPLASPGSGWPVIRLNAIPVTHWPTMCRRVVCDIGGTKEVRDTIAERRASILGVRTQKGVLAFGSDAEIRKTFSPYHIMDFDCYNIELRRLRFESAEFGLLRDAFARALQVNRPFIVERLHSEHILRIDFTRASVTELALLKDCTGELTGKIPKISVEWSEALRAKLDYQLNRLWLLFEPMIYIGNIADTAQRHVASDFARERLATRYNRQWNALIEAWLVLIMNGQQEIQLRAFSIEDGIDASFMLSRITAFSRRNGSR
jgi:NAD-dependent SIR2 family protein deacetylase